MNQYDRLIDVLVIRIGISVLSIAASYYGYAFIVLSAVAAPAHSTRLAVARWFSNELIAGATAVIVVLITVAWAFKRSRKSSPLELLVLIPPVALWTIFVLA